MLELRVGAQRGEEGLLEAVVGVDPSDRAAQHAEHFAGVPVEQSLEWRQRCGHAVIKRSAGPGVRPAR